MRFAIDAGFASSRKVRWTAMVRSSVAAMRSKARDHLLDGGGAHPAPAVQHALDRRRADAGAAGNFEEGGLWNG